MKVFIKLILLVVVFNVGGMVKAADAGVRDSLTKEQIIKYGREKLVRLVAANRKYEMSGRRDSLNYILNINTNDIARPPYEDTYPDASYIKQKRPNGLDPDLAKYMLDEAKLQALNNTLIGVNQVHEIKSYLLLVNFVPLALKEGDDFNTIADVFVRHLNNKQVSASLKNDQTLVQGALNLAAEIVQGVTTSTLNAATEKMVFLGWCKFKTVFNKSATRLITVYYPNSKKLDTENGYKNVLKRNIDAYPFLEDEPSDEVARIINVIKKTNEDYSAIESLNNTIESITDPKAMQEMLSEVLADSYAIFDRGKRLHILKVLSGQDMPEERQALIDDIIATTPSNDFDYLLDHLLDANDKAPQFIEVAGGKPGETMDVPNPKYGYKVLNCILYNAADIVDCKTCFGWKEENYLRMMRDILIIYSKSKQFKEKQLDLYALNSDDFKKRCIIWNRSYFLSVDRQPDWYQDPIVNYDYSTSYVKYKVKEYIDRVCGTTTITLTNSANVPKTYSTYECIDKYDYTDERVLLPFDMVVFADQSDLSMLNAVASKGQAVLGQNSIGAIYAPAILLKYASDNRWRKDAFKAIEDVLNVLIIVVPGGQVALLGETINFIYRVIDFSIKVAAALKLLRSSEIIKGNPRLNSFIDGYDKLTGYLGLFNVSAGLTDLKLQRTLQKNAEDYFATFYEAEEDLINLKNTNPGLLSENQLKEMYSFNKSIEEMGKAAGYGEDWVRALQRAVLEKRGLLGNKIFSQFFEEGWAGKVVIADGENGIKLVKDINENTVLHLSADGKNLYLDVVRELPEDGKFIKMSVNEEFFVQGAATAEKNTVAFYQLPNGDIVCVLKVCFVKGTKVHTKKGLVAIEDIKKNDVVLSYDEKRKTNVWQKVASVFSKSANKLIRVIAGKDTITATPEHPFYTEKGWRSAKELVKGLKVKLVSGAMAAVVSTIPFDSVATVYNFEVDSTHNYYVSTNGILVHNDCELVAKLKNYTDFETEFIRDFEKGRDALVVEMDNTPGLIKAWEVLRDRGPSLKFNLELLKVIERTLITKNVDEFSLKDALDNCATGKVPRLSAANAANTIYKFRNHKNIQKVVEELASTKSIDRTGASFMIRVAEVEGPVAIGSFEHLWLQGTQASADMLMVDGSIRELKSWGLDYVDGIPLRKLTYQQARYFQNRSDNYFQWFDFDRFPTAQFPHADDARNYIIGKYQELFRKDNYAAYNTIGQNALYFQTKGITSASDFQIAVEDIHSHLWDFVDVK